MQGRPAAGAAAAQRSAFVQLQPICAPLLALRGDPGALAAALERLEEALPGVEPIGLAACLDYVLFPLTFIVDSAALLRASQAPGAGTGSAFGFACEHARIHFFVGLVLFESLPSLFLQDCRAMGESMWMKPWLVQLSNACYLGVLSRMQPLRAHENHALHAPQTSSPQSPEQGAEATQGKCRRRRAAPAAGARREQRPRGRARSAVSTGAAARHLRRAALGCTAA